MTDVNEVSVLGLGRLGTRLAQAFLAAGYRTAVWNRTPAKARALVPQGAVRIAGPGEAVAAADIVVVCLPDYATVRALLEPVAGQLRGRTLVNLTSGTPEEARAMARWAAGQGAEYLDGAAMSGTRLVGRPEALFVFSGAPTAFAAHGGVLRSLGNAVELGADPGLAAVYDAALFGMVWGALAGFHHAVALAGAEGVPPVAFARTAAGHLGFAASLLPDHARQIEDGRYPDDDGRVAVHAAAMRHLAQAGAAHGVPTDVPDLIGTLLARAEAVGHGADGIASIAETLRPAAARATAAVRGSAAQAR